MKKRILACFLCLAMLVGMLTISVSAQSEEAPMDEYDYWKGSGTVGDPYQIWTIDDLQLLADTIGDNVTTLKEKPVSEETHKKWMSCDNPQDLADTVEYFSVPEKMYIGKVFKLMADIEEPLEKPIGNYPQNIFALISAETPPAQNWQVRTYPEFYTDTDNDGVSENVYTAFGGIFDGNGHSVALDIDQPDKEFVALFPFLLAGASVKNLTVTGSVKGKSAVAGVVAYNLGEVTNCANQAAVSGVITVGGIVAGNGTNITMLGAHSIVSSSRNDGAITGRFELGGIVGANNGVIASCINTGAVCRSTDTQSTMTDAYIGIGGIAGDCTQESCTVNCTNSGTIGSSTDVLGYMGGIVGTTFMAEFYGCENTGSIVAGASTENIGGLIGNAMYELYLCNCCNSGSITVGSSCKNVGGLIGKTDLSPEQGKNAKSGCSTIANCYNIGTITASGCSAIGGFAGFGNDNCLTNCYNAGLVSGTDNTEVGGLCGHLDGDHVFMSTHCFYADGYSLSVGTKNGQGESNPLTIEEIQGEESGLTAKLNDYVEKNRGKKQASGDSSDFARWQLDPVSSYPVYLVHKHDGQKFMTPWTAETTPWSGSRAGRPQIGGSYYLDEDIELGQPLVLEGGGSALLLCLNGHTITLQGNACIGSENPNSLLCIYDCGEEESYFDCGSWKKLNEQDIGEKTVVVTAEEYNRTDAATNAGNYVLKTTGGCITGATASGAIVNKGVFHLYGGSLIGNSTADKYGSAITSWSSLNNRRFGDEPATYLDYDFTCSGITVMHGGLIAGNSKGSGPVDLLCGAQFQMYGGSITANSGSSFGAVGVDLNSNVLGYFIFDGGLINSNEGRVGGLLIVRSQANLNNTKICDNYGGGIVLSNAAIALEDTEITGNSAEISNGGLNCDSSGTIFVRGSTKIINNTGAGRPNNLCIINCLPTLKSSELEDTVIGVSATFFPGEVFAAENGDMIPYLYSDHPDRSLAFASGKISIVSDYSCVIQIKLSENGRISVRKPIYNPGEAVDVAVTPDEGYKLKKLTCLDFDTNEELDITKELSCTAVSGKTFVLSAEFEKDEAPAPYYGGGSDKSFSIQTPGSFSNGTVHFSSTNPRPGSVVTVTVTPDEGYELSGLTIQDAKGGVIELVDLGDGKYSFIMPDSNITAEALFRLIAVCQRDESCALNRFGDLSPSGWYHDGIEYCLNHGIMNGVGSSAFAPSQPITRAMIVQMLYRLEGEPAFMNDNVFSDVASGSWYEKAVVWANGKNIVNGVGGGSFLPNAPITREQLASILYRYAQYKGIDTSAVTADTNTLSFDDVFTIRAYAAEAMHFCIAAGVLTGSGSLLRPADNSTRAEAAAMFYRFSRLLEN